jgi:hypothetical protein
MSFRAGMDDRRDAVQSIRRWPDKKMRDGGMRVASHRLDEPIAPAYVIH